VPHPSAYVDPLRASDERKAVGVVNSQGILMAIGDEATGEWIRMESETWGYPVKR
jgi:hypothetical protein